MTTDLAEEFLLACCSITSKVSAELRAAGIRPHNLDGAQLVGVSPIEPYASGLFEPRDEGPPAVLAPCGCWDGLNWRVEDLVAFHPDRPERWWRRVGVADVLGDVHGFSIKPKRLHLHPLAWLQDGGKGLVILDWGVDVADLLLGAGPVVANRFLMNRLRKAAVKSATARIDRAFSNG